MTPEFVYLYLKKDDFTAKKLLSILCGYLPLSNARRFNDLFDSNFLYDLPDTVTLKDGERDAIEKGYFSEQMFLKIRQRVAEKEIREKYNVACFGECHDSLLMWAHYADSHKGLCLQLKYFPEKRPEGCAFEKVHYSTRYPRIDGAKTDDISTVKNLFFTKSVEWLYEKEWRLVAPASMKGGKDFDGQIESR
jgi:hypothetical protein